MNISHAFLLRVQVMYYALGRTFLLQPDESQSFVFGGADHPMLPPGPNLFALREPWNISEAADQLARHLSNNIRPAATISSQAGSSNADRYIHKKAILVISISK